MLRYLVLLALVASIAAAHKEDEDKDIELYDDTIDDPLELARANSASLTEWDHNWDAGEMRSGDSITSRRHKKKKKKHKHKKKKMLKMMATALMVKAAMLPLALGFLKMLTGKAVMVTMMALGLVSALTYKGASEKSVTEVVINLVPQHKGRSQDVEPEKIAQYIHHDYEKH